MKKASKRFVLIDANALIHRAFHALPDLTTQDHLPVNAVYGFVSILLRVLKELKPDYVAAAFDRKEKTFRHEAYEAYKATRVKAPDELYQQIPFVKEVLKAFRIPIFEKAGFEADDIIGSIAKKYANGTHVTIVSGDMDILQLVDKSIDVYTMKRSISDVVIYDEGKVAERFDGLKPTQLIDYKALAGDPSDNLPGVKGIGEKTAIQLLQHHHTIEQLYQDLENGKTEDVKPRIQLLLTEGKASAKLCKQLATIDVRMNLSFTLSDAMLKDYDHEDVIRVFQKFEFRSLLPRVAQLANRVGARHSQSTLFSERTSSARTTSHPNTTKHYQLIQSENDFQTFVSQLATAKLFALDTETDQLSGLFGRCVGISISWQPHHGYFLDYKSVREYRAWKSFQKILEDPHVKKMGHNIKYDLEVLRSHGISLDGIAFDTMIASYVLNPGTRQNKLEQLALAEFGYEMQPIEELIGTGKHQRSMADVEIDRVSWYAAEDADLTWQLYAPLQKRVEEQGMMGLLEKIEMPLIPVLATMESNGAMIDVPFLQQLSKSLAFRIRQLKQRIHRVVGEEVNIASTQQLSKALFQKLKLSSEQIKKTQTGGISTSASELEKLKGQHPVIEHLLQFRELTKLQSTYVEALPELVRPETSRVHTSYNQTIAATGRLSSSNPNLQNIPVRTEEGREIRKAFIAPSKFQLLSIDYSQMELRIAASLSNDQKMLEIFRSHLDIHKQTAAEIHNVPVSRVTPEMRYAAKEVNFGVLYGMGAFGLAWRAGISRHAASEFIRRYFEVFSGIREYVEQAKELAVSRGYAETLLGRRRYIPELRSHNGQLRAAGERMAVNMPIQGLQADLLKLAMIEVDRRLPRISERASMILQVHDELVFEVPRAHIRKVASAVKEIMENVYELRVPIVAECKVGDNWGEMQKLDV